MRAIGTHQRVGAAAVALVALALGCTGLPDGVEPVRDFELERYLGTWHEIARLDHRFERGLEDVSASYSLRDDGGVRVRNRGFDPEKGEWREAIGRAYLQGDPDVASLKVSFFGPFYGGYHVIALDREGYGDAVVSGPNRETLWILSRDRKLTAERRETLLSVVREAGFDVEALIWVPQERSDPALADSR